MIIKITLAQISAIIGTPTAPGPTYYFVSGGEVKYFMYAGFSFPPEIVYELQPPMSVEEFLALFTPAAFEVVDIKP